MCKYPSHAWCPTLAFTFHVYSEDAIQIIIQRANRLRESVFGERNFAVDDTCATRLVVGTCITLLFHGIETQKSDVWERLQMLYTSYSFIHYE